MWKPVCGKKKLYLLCWSAFCFLATPPKTKFTIAFWAAHAPTNSPRTPARGQKFPWRHDVATVVARRSAENTGVAQSPRAAFRPSVSPNRSPSKRSPLSPRRRAWRLASRRASLLWASRVRLHCAKMLSKIVAAVCMPTDLGAFSNEKNIFWYFFPQNLFSTNRGFLESIS